MADDRGPSRGFACGNLSVNTGTPETYPREGTHSTLSVTNVSQESSRLNDYLPVGREPL